MLTTLNYGSCVVCTSNSDCSGITPICDTTTHTCRGCSSYHDCIGFTHACVANKNCSITTTISIPSTTIYASSIPTTSIPTTTTPTTTT